MHDAHQDEINRAYALAKHERAIIGRVRLHVVETLLQPPAPQLRSEHMIAPGDVDDTGFSDGIC